MPGFPVLHCMDNDIFTTSDLFKELIVSIDAFIESVVFGLNAIFYFSRKRFFFDSNP